ncbi:conjugative transposon protein TraN [Porphyromonas levii]|nr:conjugative transposon protein TraN [Porphyromonas levii]MBR8712261.1 hypothetical protein [Porphyromonas levii]MBR8714273.1 hypothetical protein [Porphyromonas levii]MBR8726814.1 hypothetical protein [Porphyromonas levii]MBR8735121.1 hypothetical protein [Porphyromonas levii]MBR8766503.1 hypothetical protein [Porphyromonas levii]
MRIIKSLFVAMGLCLTFPFSSQAQGRVEAKGIPSDRVITPYQLEVSSVKTVHILFPSSVVYVDLGTPVIAADVPADAQNIVRVKAVKERFNEETNLSVVCEDGSFYNFNVVYRHQPSKLNIEMQSYSKEADATAAPQNNIGVLTSDLYGESPREVDAAMKYIANQNRTLFRHIGVQKYGIQFQLKSLHYHGGIYYFHLYVKNGSKVGYILDYVDFKVVDKKLAKRSAMQIQQLQPVRVYNLVQNIKGSGRANVVFAIPIFSMPDGKVLEISLYEKGGGRTLSMIVDGDDLLKAHELDNFRKIDYEH